MTSLLSCTAKKKNAAHLPAYHTQALREQGNAAFKRGAHQEAVEAYSSAIAVEDSAVLRSNRSAAHAGAGSFSDALADGLAALQLQPGWCKGEFRCATALEGLSQFQEAANAYARAAVSTPSKEERANMTRLRDAAAMRCARPSPRGVSCAQLRLFRWFSPVYVAVSRSGKTLTHIHSLASFRASASPDGSTICAHAFLSDASLFECCKAHAETARALDATAAAACTPAGVAAAARLCPRVERLAVAFAEPLTRRQLEALRGAISPGAAFDCPSDRLAALLSEWGNPATAL